MFVRVWLAVVCLVFCVGSLSPAEEPRKAISIATWNVEWLYDDYRGDNFSKLAKEQSAPSSAEWDWRREALADAIAKMQPTILALQEIEGGQVAYELTQQLKKSHQLNYRYAVIRGSDYYTEQDVAFLYRDGLVQYSRNLQNDEMFRSGDYYNVSKHLLGQFEWQVDGQAQRLLVLTLHFRARPDKADLRVRQARLVHHWLRDAIVAGENVVVLGDTNSEVMAGTEKPTDDLGVLRGLHTKGTQDDLLDLHLQLPEDQRQTHLLPGKQFDRILVSQALNTDDPARPDLVFRKMARRKDLCVRGKEADSDHWNVKYYDIPQQERDLSDHYPLVAEFEIR